VFPEFSETLYIAVESDTVRSTNTTRETLFQIPTRDTTETDTNIISQGKLDYFCPGHCLAIKDAPRTTKLHVGQKATIRLRHILSAVGHDTTPRPNPLDTTTGREVRRIKRADDMIPRERRPIIERHFQSVSRGRVRRVRIVDLTESENIATTIHEARGARENETPKLSDRLTHDRSIRVQRRRRNDVQKIQRELSILDVHIRLENLFDGNQLAILINVEIIETTLRETPHKEMEVRNEFALILSTLTRLPLNTPEARRRRRHTHKTLNESIHPNFRSFGEARNIIIENIIR